MWRTKTLTMSLAVAGLLMFQAGSSWSSEPSVDELPALRQLDDYVSSDANALDELTSQDFATTPLTRQQCVAAERSLWAAYRNQIRHERAKEHAANVVQVDGISMKYRKRRYEEPPAGGYSLVISMHGGGGTTARVNDQQWQNQIGLYTLEQGIYVAPRAPTDAWNMWHLPHIDPLFTRLIENMVLLENVNPDRVYLTGYSAGGDGVYQLAPRMADQFAAAAMMAGHPNETKPLGLRNLPFTLHMGERDAAYQRNEHAARWKRELATLRENDPEGYRHWVEIHAEKGHWMDRQDASGVKWMMQFSRNLLPQRVAWLQDDVLHHRFYWLAVPDGTAKQGSKIIASRNGNTFAIEASDVDRFALLLRDDFVDLDSPIEVIYEGRTIFSGPAKRTIASLWSSIVDRGDPAATFSCRVPIALTDEE